VEELLLLSNPHHPATGVVEDLAEAAEEAAVAAEEDNELNFMIPYSLNEEAARINFSCSLFL
jgi:hypothetical protein